MISIPVTVAATPTLLADQGDQIEPLLVTVQNNGSQTVFLGASGVTTSTGFHLLAGASQQVILFSGQKLYGVVAATTAACVVLETPATGGLLHLVTAAYPLVNVLSFGDDAGGQQIKNMADPTAAQDAATKHYVDAGGVVTSRVVAGAAANASIAVSGIDATDALVDVIRFHAGVPSSLLGEASITGAGTIKCSTTNTTGDTLVVLFLSKP